MENINGYLIETKSIDFNELGTHKLDAFVLFSAEQFSFDSSYGEKFLEAGGSELQQECEYYKKELPFFQGTFLTRAGRLPYNCIVHARTPDASSLEQVKSKVIESIFTAERASSRSIGIPVDQLLGNEKEASITAIVRTLFTYFLNPSTVPKISRFILYVDPSLLEIASNIIHNIASEYPPEMREAKVTNFKFIGWRVTPSKEQKPKLPTKLFTSYPDAKEIISAGCTATGILFWRIISSEIELLLGKEDRGWTFLAGKRERNTEGKVTEPVEDAAVREFAEEAGAIREDATQNTLSLETIESLRNNIQNVPVFTNGNSKFCLFIMETNDQGIMNLPETYSRTPLGTEASNELKWFNLKDFVAMKWESTREPLRSYLKDKSFLGYLRNLAPPSGTKSTKPASPQKRVYVSKKWNDNKKI